MLCTEMHLTLTVKVSECKQAPPSGSCSRHSYKQDLKKCCAVLPCTADHQHGLKKFCVNNWQPQPPHCHSRFSFKPHELPRFVVFRSIKHWAIHFHLFSLFPMRVVLFCFLILHTLQGNLTHNHCAKWACEKRISSYGLYSLCIYKNFKIVLSKYFLTVMDVWAMLQNKAKVIQKLYEKKKIFCSSGIVKVLKQEGNLQ